MGCAADERTCGSECCVAGDYCGTNERCCAVADLCGSECCGQGEVCEGAVCKLDCGADARCLDDGGADVCCAPGELCASGQCFAPSIDCDDFFDCPQDTYCEQTLGQCLPQPGGDACEDVPVGGAVLPTLLWHWDGTGAALPQYHQVMMTPMVAKVDDDDIPDVVFNTFCGDSSAGCTNGNYTTDGVLRVVSGADGSAIVDVTGPRAPRRARQPDRHRRHRRRWPRRAGHLRLRGRRTRRPDRLQPRRLPALAHLRRPHRVRSGRARHR